MFATVSIWLIKLLPSQSLLRGAGRFRNMFRKAVRNNYKSPKYLTDLIILLETERFYVKDAVCPSQWKGWLMESNIPSMLKPGSSEDVLELLPESVHIIYISTPLYFY